MDHLPAVGSTYASREELHALVRQVGKQRGYIFKQSITSASKVNWYCSNKYGTGAKCLAGFKAQLEQGGEWLVTEALDHNDACTRVRQKVLSRKTGSEIPEEGPLPPVTSYNTASSSSSSSSVGGAAARAGSIERSLDAGPSATSRGWAGSASMDMDMDMANASSSSMSAPAPKRRAASKSTSSASSARTSSPNSVVAPGSSISGGSLSSAFHYQGRYRPRSYSQTSTSTSVSSKSTDPTRTPGSAAYLPAAPPKITILDPSFHFPGVDLEGVLVEAELNHDNTLRSSGATTTNKKRKRSASNCSAATTATNATMATCVSKETEA